MKKGRVENGEWELSLENGELTIVNSPFSRLIAEA